MRPWHPDVNKFLLKMLVPGKAPGSGGLGPGVRSPIAPISLILD